MAAGVWELARACVSPRLELHPGVASKTRALRWTQRLRGHQTGVQALWGSSRAIYAWAGVDQMEAETPHPFPRSNQDVPPSAPGPRCQLWGVTGGAPPSWLSKCSLYTFAFKKTNKTNPLFGLSDLEVVGEVESEADRGRLAQQAAGGWPGEVGDAATRAPSGKASPPGQEWAAHGPHRPSFRVGLGRRAATPPGSLPPLAAWGLMQVTLTVSPRSWAPHGTAAAPLGSHLS